MWRLTATMATILWTGSRSSAEKGKGMHKINVTFTVDVTDEYIKAIMDKVSEGTAHWCDSIRCSSACPGRTIYEYMFVNGGKLVFHNKIRPGNYYLTKNRFMEGIRRYMENPVEGDILEYGNGRMWTTRLHSLNMDRDIVDAIIQYALFDKIIYHYRAKTGKNQAP